MIPPNFENIPAELTALPQWVPWRYEQRGDKRTKAPIDAKSNGRLSYAKSNDPATWASHAEALAACELHPELAGIGFCFAPDDGLTGIDLDHVIDPDTGELKPEAAEILERFKDTYVEVSPSGTGLRVFCYGKPGRSGKNVGKAKWCEVYSHPSSRYLTVTGNHWTGSATAVTEQQDALDWLHDRFMVSTGGKPSKPSPSPARSLDLDDTALLDKAGTAKNGGAFRALWSGDTSGHGGDDSAADQALNNHLAFWTGCDPDRMDRLFRQSGLMRPKWDSKRGEGETYGSLTIRKAIQDCPKTYQPVSTTSNNPPTAKTPDKPPRCEAGAYVVSHDGRLFHNKPVGPNLFEPKLLANFDARIKAEILVDDGAEQRRELEISVTLCTGKALPTISIPASQFPGMGWVVAQCGSVAVLNAGQTVKDHTRCAIQLLSNGHMEQRTVFEHSGWRRIDDKWLYLFNGGAIGADGIETQHAVQLPGTLRDYVLHRPDDSAAAIRAALNVLDVAPPEVAIPAFLAPWRALLGEAMPVDFSLFLQGPTGVRKTEVAAIIQAHWGAAWHGKHLPAAWSSTANSLERLAFQTKDAVMVVDDFAPNGSTTDISRAHSNADRLLRAQGNRAGRGRMNADGSMRPEYFPRGLIVATGEDVLRGQSARGRTLVLEFEPQTVNLSILSELQVAAGQGLLAGAAGAFCQWLATRMDALKADLPGRRIDLRNAISAKNASHSRHPDTLASLQITAEVFAEFAADHGVILDPGWLEHIEAGLRAAGDTQAQFQATEEPAARFVRLIHAGLASGRCHVYPLDGKKPSPSEDMTAKGWQLRTFGNEFNARQDWYECGPRIGRFEHDNLYLDPEAAYATVQEFAHHQGQPIQVSQRTLYKALNQKGFILSKDPDGKRLTIKKLLPDGKRPRFLHIGGGVYKKWGKWDKWGI